MSGDNYIDHQKLAGPQYLLWHDSNCGFRFGDTVWRTLREANEDADGFRKDGYETRIIKLEVVDGGPVATWV